MSKDYDSDEPLIEVTATPIGGENWGMSVKY